MQKEADVPFIVTARRAGSLAKLLVVEFILVFFLASAYAEVRRQLGAHGCAPEPGAISWQTFLLLFAGLYALYWVFLKQILFAKVIVDETVGGPFPYSFLTTHPSYVAIDLITVGIAWIVHYAGGTVEVGECANTQGYLLGSVALPIACLIPIFRLVLWYLAGQRTWERLQRPELETAWKPVALFWGVLALPGALALHWVLQDRRVDASWPVADASTMAGGLAAHPEFDDMVWKVRGKIMWERVSRCKCDGAGGCAQGEMMLDLGAGGEVLIRTTYAGGVRELAADTEGRVGKLYTKNGRLHKLPNPKARQCGDYGPPPPAGRALLEPAVLGADDKSLKVRQPL